MAMTGGPDEERRDRAYGNFPFEPLWYQIVVPPGRREEAGPFLDLAHETLGFIGRALGIGLQEVPALSPTRGFDRIADMILDEPGFRHGLRIEMLDGEGARASILESTGFGLQETPGGSFHQTGLRDAVEDLLVTYSEQRGLPGAQRLEIVIADIEAFASRVIRALDNENSVLRAELHRTQIEVDLLRDQVMVLTNALRSQNKQAIPWPLKAVGGLLLAVTSAAVGAVTTNALQDPAPTDPAHEIDTVEGSAFQLNVECEHLVVRLDDILG